MPYKEYINLIKNKKNDILNNKLKEYYENYNPRYHLDILNSKTNLYDIAIKNNNFEAFNILLKYDNIWKWFSEDSVFFDSAYLQKQLKKGFIVSKKFVNLILKITKGDHCSTLLKLVFQNIGFNNEFILQFLINYYSNKTPLSTSKLNKIINEKNEKLNRILNNNNCNNYCNYSSNISCDSNSSNSSYCYREESNIEIDNSEVPLSIACEKGNEFAIKYLIKLGADANSPYKTNECNSHHDEYHNQDYYVNSMKEWKTPFINVFKNGNKSIVDYLIQHGADINTKYKLETIKYIQDGHYSHINNEYTCKEIKTPLFLACEQENESMVKYLVEHGADVNEVYECRKYTEGSNSIRNYYFCDIIKVKSPLSMACEKGNESIVKCLVEHGADINAKYEYLNYEKLEIITPLMYACKNGNVSIVNYLIEHGADINITFDLVNYQRIEDYYGSFICKNIRYIKFQTPLTIACKEENESVVKSLIAHGADINKEYNLFEYQEDNEYLSNKYDNEDEKDNKYYKNYWNYKLIKIKTPLTIACKRNNETMVKYLVEQGAKVNAKDEYINTLQYLEFKSPIGIACENGYESIVKYLIKHKANINHKYTLIKNENLTYSIYPYRNRIMRFLIVKTPLISACEKKNESIVKLLLEHRANTNSEYMQYKYQELIDDDDDDDDDEIKYNYNYNNYQIIEIKTPLGIACENKNESIVKDLVEHGANINAQYEAIERIKYIDDDEWRSLDHKIKFIAVKTALISACEKRNESLIKYLVEHGANTNVKFESYKYMEQPYINDHDFKKVSEANLLYFVSKMENKSIVKYLIEHGAEANSNIKYYNKVDDIKLFKQNDHNLSNENSNENENENEENEKLKSKYYLNGNETNISYLIKQGVDVYFKFEDDKKKKQTDKPMNQQHIRKKNNKKNKHTKKQHQLQEELNE